MSIKIVFSMIYISVIVLEGWAVLYQKPSRGLSDEEILNFMAQKIKLTNFYADINNKKYPIYNKDAALAFKKDVLKETILKKELVKNPGLYEKSKKLVLANRPAYLTMEQTQSNITVLLGSTLKCEAIFNQHKKITADELKKLPCLGLFEQPGGFSSRELVSISFKDFDVSNIDDPQHQKKWDDLVKKKMIELALQKFINDYRVNS